MKGHNNFSSEPPRNPRPTNRNAYLQNIVYRLQPENSKIRRRLYSITKVLYLILFQSTQFYQTLESLISEMNLFTLFSGYHCTEHIHYFTNLKFVWENSIVHLCLILARFSKTILICKDWIFKKNNIERTRISRWLGRENKENVARTRNCSRQGVKQI